MHGTSDVESLGSGILIVQGLGLFPIEGLIRKMSVLGCLAVDRLGQIELFHNDTWPHVEVVLDNCD